MTSRREAIADALHLPSHSLTHEECLFLADAAIAAYESWTEPTIDAGDDPAPWDVWVWWNEKVGMKAGKLPGKEAAAAKRLVDMGITIGDLDRLWDWMKQDPWYAEKGIDLPLMAAAVLKWRAADAVRKTQAVRWDGHR
jgi:hypothetical protein